MGVDNQIYRFYSLTQATIYRLYTAENLLNIEQTILILISGSTNPKVQTEISLKFKIYERCAANQEPPTEVPVTHEEMRLLPFNLCPLPRAKQQELSAS